ncbi:MAG: DsbA family oxidoreductase [Microbacteriaceae bacterium]|nr:DsbA family oxidoreductase [Microbacteriaceae bacterium]
MSNSIKVDIWSDIACPWCYIGKRKFEAGATEFGEPIEVEYHSYELAPDTSEVVEGTALQRLFEYKGVPLEQAKEMINRVVGVAAQVGLNYDYDAVQSTNTIRAHELLHYAKSQGRQVEMKERLFRAHFVEGRHVGRAGDLADLAAEIGLDREDALRALTAREFLPAVDADKAQAREYGIQGVPFFVIDGKYGISGAQDASVFAAALRQAKDEKDAAA